jgi:hypothetical protein
MQFRLKAFALHLSASVALLTVILGALYLGWYRWPGWYLTGVVHVIGMVAMVDLALGPSLTLIVANPRKPRRALARDIGVIVLVQLAALVYGATTLWLGRPLYYTFSVDRLEIVQASELEPAEIALARAQNPALAPHWYSVPRWIWAPLPDDPEQAAKIAQAAVFGGQDVIEMPRYFKPWDQGLPQLREQLKRVDEMKELYRSERGALRTRMTQLGLAPDQPNALLLWGGGRRLLVIFEPGALHIRAILKP